MGPSRYEPQPTDWVVAREPSERKLRFRGLPCSPSACLSELLSLFTQTFNAEPHDVARFQEPGSGLWASPTPGGVPVVMMSPGSSAMKREQ